MKKKRSEKQTGENSKKNFHLKLIESDQE